MSRFSFVFATVMGLWAIPTFAQSITVSKNNVPHFAGSVPCVFADGLCPQALQGFTGHVLLGENGFEDATQFPKDSATGRNPLVLDFPDGKTFDWNKYSFDSPLNQHKFLLLNELSSSGSNHAMLSEWRVSKGELTLIRLLPQVYEIPLGELSFSGKPILQGAGFLVLLHGLGSDAGVNYQDYRVLRLDAQSNLQVITRVTNNSEIPVATILARLNEGGNVEEVTDSTLTCSLVRGGKKLNCSKTLTRIRYSLSGAEEIPLNKSSFTLELSKAKSK
jgi:hypothetical protein